MWFGLRLPGPFRVGFNRRGTVVGGVTIGPLSISERLAAGRARRRRRAPVWLPCTFDEAVAQARAEGFKVVTVRRSRSRNRHAVIERGWTAARIVPIPGGVALHRVTASRTTLTVIAAALATILLCCVLPSLLM